MEYIHYGDDTFRPEKCTVERGIHPAKPKKGLWASPVISDWGWKDWCESEQWAPRDFDWSKSFTFTLKEEANILYVHSEDDIMDYVIKDESTPDWLRFTKTSVIDKLDVERLYKDYDGMEVFMSDNWNEFHNGIFNSWDCDSLVVWNPEVIRPC